MTNKQWQYDDDETVIAREQAAGMDEDDIIAVVCEDRRGWGVFDTSGLVNIANVRRDLPTWLCDEAFEALRAGRS